MWKLHALYLESRVHRIPRTPEMLADQGQTVRERRLVLVVPGGHRHRICPSPLNCRASTVTSENSPNRTGVVRAMARADHWRGVSSPRWVRASSHVTST